MPVYRIKGTDKWEFRTYYNNALGERKQYHSGAYDSKKEAKAGEDSFLNTVTNNELYDKSLTFKELKEAYFNYKKSRVRSSTLSLYYGLERYVDFFNNYKVVNINLNTFENFKNYLDGFNFSSTYKNDILGLFKAILNFGSKFYNYNFTHLLNNITEFRNPDGLKKEMEFYTLEEYKQFIKKEDNPEWKLFFDVLYYLGLRKGEIRGLQWKEIDFKNKFVTLHKQIPSKCGKNNWHFAPLKTKASYRTLPINAIVMDELEKLLEEKKKFKDFSYDWFIFGDVNPINCSDINYRKKRREQESHVKHIRTHDFRHSCASLLMANGASIILIMRYLGHSRMDETLNTYTHLFKSELDSIVKIIEKL